MANTSPATPPAPSFRPAGILLRGDPASARHDFLARLRALHLEDCVEVAEEEAGCRFRLRDERADAWVPQGDTTQLSRTLHLDIERNDEDLEREILIAMLAAPIVFDYPDYVELAAAVRIRRNIAQAARRTQLAFDTEEVNRPTDCWTYSEERGFTILPGKPLIDALRKATQPDASNTLYAFSCYRATEYVILLGIAEELAVTHPALLQQLQRQWETRAIMSGRFHDVFLREYGSLEQPLPDAYYVPGERLWFRNPDERSSDIAGYEGSWVIYLGGGLFANFWKRNQPYTLTGKCVEVFHWRHGAHIDASGALVMDEAVVEARTRETLGDAEETARILQRMRRMRDPQGVYAEGGCIDASREYPRCVCPGTADMVLPSP